MSTENAASLKSIKIIRDGDGSYHGFLLIRQIDESSKPTPYSWKLTISGAFKSSVDVTREGDKLYERFLKGEITVQQYAEKVKLRGYRIIGRARFDADGKVGSPRLS